MFLDENHIKILQIIEMFFNFIFNLCNVKLKMPQMTEKVSEIIFAAPELGIVDDDLASARLLTIILCCSCLPQCIDTTKADSTNAQNALVHLLSAYDSDVPVIFKGADSLEKILSDAVGARKVKLAAAQAMLVEQIVFPSDFEDTTETVKNFLKQSQFDDTFKGRMRVLRTKLESEKVQYQPKMELMKERLDALFLLTFDNFFKFASDFKDEISLLRLESLKQKNIIDDYKKDLDKHSKELVNCNTELAKTKRELEEAKAKAATSVIVLPSHSGGGGGPAGDLTLAAENAQLRAHIQEVRDYYLQLRSVAQRQHAVVEKIEDFYGDLYDFKPVANPAPLQLPWEKK